VFFGFDFSRETVAVEALGEKDVVTSHAFEASYYVEISVVEGVSHVEIATRIRRRSINGEDWTFCVIPIEAVSAHFFPEALPLLLDFENVAFFWQWFHDSSSSNCDFA